VHWLLGDFTGAAQHIADATSASPEDPLYKQGLQVLVLNLVDLGRFNEVALLLRRATQIYPGEYRWASALASALVRTGEESAALTELRRFLAEDEARSVIAQLKSEAGR
jgi:Flp pilus assembly protein TadD